MSIIICVLHSNEDSFFYWGVSVLFVLCCLSNMCNQSYIIDEVRGKIRMFKAYQFPMCRYSRSSYATNRNVDIDLIHEYTISFCSFVLCHAVIKDNISCVFADGSMCDFVSSSVLSTASFEIKPFNKSHHFQEVNGRTT